MKRAEKMILAAGAGVVCVGLVLSLAAFAMGGRPASMVVERDGIEVRRNESGNVAFGMIQGSSDDTQKVPSAPSVADESANSPSVAQVDGWTEYELPSSDRFELEAGACKVTVKMGEAGTDPVLRVKNVPQDKVLWKQDEGWLEIELCSHFNGNDIQEISEHREAELILPPEVVRLKLKSAAGSITADGFALEYLEAEAAAGSVTITNTTASGASFEAEAGSVSFSGALSGNVEAEVQAGSIDITTSSTVEKASFSTQAGSVTFTGGLSGILEADAEMGSIEINLPRPQQYSWKIETELGSVTIDGQKFGSGARQQGGSGSPVFDLETEVGGITVNFS